MLPCRLLFEIRDRVCPDPFRVRGAEDVAKSVSVVDDGLVSLSCNGMEHLHRPPYRPNPDAYDIALADRQVDRNRLSHTDQAGTDPAARTFQNARAASLSALAGGVGASKSSAASRTIA